MDEGVYFMKKTALIVLISLIVTILAASTFMVGCKKKKQDVNYENNDLKGIESDASIAEWMIYDENSTQEELKALVERVYKNACELDQKLEYRRTDVVCNVTTVGTMVQYVTTIKNGNEYVRLETQVPDGETPSLMKSILKDQIYFKGDYADMQHEKAVEIETKKGVSYEDGVISADLDSVNVSYVDKPYFNASQELKYTQTDFVITKDTIKDVSISHNDEEGFYIVELSVDVENEEAIAKPYANLSSNVKKAKYLSVREHIEIWDNGYFRAFYSLDNWKGTVVVSIEGDIDYRTYFVYDEAQCQIDGLFAIDKLREEIAKQ